MKYKYFVSYFFKSDILNFGTGCGEITRKNKITSFEDIKEITGVLEENEDIKKVTIINYILLEESEDKK